MARELLASTGQMGAEQYIAAELVADTRLQDALVATLHGDPVLEVVLGRIASMEAFRRLHFAAAGEEPERISVRAMALGRAQVVRDGKPVTGLKKQAKELFFFLVDRKRATKDMIAEGFWPEFSSGRRSANTHTAVHAIRAAFGKDAVRLEDEVYFVEIGPHFRFDVDEFLAAADAAERLPKGDPRRLFALTEAVRLYGGPFIPSSTSAWVVDRRRELETKYLDLISALASEALVRDQPIRVIDQLRRALAIDPLRNDFNLKYLEALGRLGQISEVSSHYERYSRLVREELGIDPPDELRSLYARLIS
jgi:two-component SAPR family response regulator